MVWAMVCSGDVMLSSAWEERVVRESYFVLMEDVMCAYRVVMDFIDAARHG